MSNIYQIIPQLFIGPIDASQNFEDLQKNNICVIVNCSKDIDNKFQLNLLKPLEEAQDWLYNNSYYIKYYRIAVDDNGNKKEVVSFYNQTRNLLEVIKKEYDSKKNILVHCLAGNQRSAAFVCAFLMFIKNISIHESIEILLEQKPNSFFFGSQINFIEALNQLEKDMNHNDQFISTFSSSVLKIPDPKNPLDALNGEG
jgi:protein-tyrosine phosphatase